MTKPLILVTNDDDITSPGIRHLVETMSELGRVVVAPDRPRSGMGHAITIGEPLRIEQVNIFDGIEAYQCSGTPVDCVKLAKDKILKRLPDMCVSGINHGSNASINVIYSGTMSAAMEAAIEGVPAIGFSLVNYDYKADFTTARQVVKSISKEVLEKGLPPHSLLNVNIPDVTPENLKGIKICRQAMAKWQEAFDERRDPRGQLYYWLTGKFIEQDHGTDTDEWALANGYVSLVPVMYDLTAHHVIPIIKSWSFYAE